MTSTTLHPRLQDLADRIGAPLGCSDWLAIDQARIDRFADATGDHQWIHVDPARAAAGPYGTTIAHGYLTLSLLPPLLASAFRIADARMALNYGLDRVRFPAAVPVGSRLRGRFVLRGFSAIAGGAQLEIEATIEREGGDRPVCVAALVARILT